MARRNLLRSRLAAALSVVAVLAAGLLTVRPVPAGAAERRIFEITVSDAGFNPPVVSNVNVGDVLMFTLYQTTQNHTVTFEDNSVCPGNRGAVPCWPELRFDDGNDNCAVGDMRLPDRRCMLVLDPGKTVRYHDAKNVTSVGEIRVLGQATTTTGPVTTTTTAPPSTTTTTQGPTTTSTTWSDTTTTTAPTQIRPFVVPDPPSTTSTMAPAAPVTVTSNGGTPAPTANKDKDKGKTKVKAAAAETPPPSTPPPSDALPPDSVFDPATLTPGPIELPAAHGDPADGDEVNLESAAVMNLLDRDEPADHRPLLLAFGALAFLLLVGGLWHWFHRASAYDPA